MLIIFGISWLLSFQINFIYASLLIALSHWFVDGLKKHISNNNKIGKYAFFIDQTIHLFFILLIIFLYNIFFELKPLINISINIKYLAIITAYIICTKPANIFIKEIFKIFEIKANNNDDELPNAGKLIGIIERFLVFTFIILSQFEAMGFLIAAKSILRFKDDNTVKTEYVLVGTMLSFGLAIALGIIINLIKI
ncbi:MAG: DUF3307 domain-containing protein [Bacteroidales bacterium]|nr:DUF3307 domain-containing protein [Bacteroidales bacterium]